jgi:predicted ABC-type transport system involved in lysophospholipase L1 biosynthesis ATPase subunit
MTAMTVVTLLTQPDCALCEHAKQVLARVGADHPLTVREIALDSDEGQRLAVAAGVMFAPGILLDGAPYAFGRLSERALRRHLDRQRTATSTTEAGT